LLSGGLDPSKTASTFDHGSDFMGTCIATWEDEENNRHIQFSVDYKAENGSVEIDTITPIKVSFICPQSNTCLRTIGVYTHAGRQMLMNYFRNRGAVDRLIDQIIARMQQPVIA
jgi:hypothetical protein